MAIIKKDILSSFTGKLGNLAIRNINGKTIAAARPSHYNKSNSDKAVSQRNKFSIVNGFAKNIYLFEELVKIWNQYSYQKSTAYNSIMSNNLKSTTNEGLTLSNIIVPPSDYNLINDISIIDNYANVTIELPQNYLSQVIESKISIFLVFAGFNENGELIFGIADGSFIAEQDAGISVIKVFPNVEQIAIIKNIENAKVFGTAVWYLRNNFDLCWSSTFGKKL